jgi:deazaflavin-dependent oxidoreductase (nitroreductase family)
MSASSPYRKPGGFRKVVNRTVARLGFAPTLAVRGRKSGQWRTVAVFVVEQDGTRYLIAPRGETQWARNLRATKEGELRHRGRVEQFRAVELPDTDKPTLIEAYVNRFGTAERPTSVRSKTSWVVRRPYPFSRISARQNRDEFKVLPNPADHPVFRPEPIRDGSRKSLPPAVAAASRADPRRRHGEREAPDRDCGRGTPAREQ